MMAAVCGGSWFARNRAGAGTLKIRPSAHDVTGRTVTYEYGTGPMYSIYVHAQEGDDANDGRSWDTPLRTLQAALRRAKPGDKVQFMGVQEVELKGRSILEALCG